MRSMARNLTATQRADELAKRRAARSAAAAGNASPTKGKRKKGKRKAGTARKSKPTASPAPDAAAAATTDADELPHVDAATDGDTVERLG